MTATVNFSFPLNTPVTEIIQAIQSHFGSALTVSYPTNQGHQLTAQHTDRIPVAGSDTPLPSGAGEPPAPSVDGEGLPWDARIHSSSKALNENGKWRLRKGVSPTQVTQIKAELARLRPGSATPVNVPTSDEALRAARLAWSEEQAYAIAGQRRNLSDTEFEAVKAGKMVTVHPDGFAWFQQWQQARNEAYGRYVPGQQVTGHPDPLDPANLNAAALFGGQAGNGSPAGGSPAGNAPAALDENTFAGLSVLVANSIKAGKLTPPDLTGTLAQLGMSNMADLVKQPDLIPAVRQMLNAFYGV